MIYTMVLVVLHTGKMYSTGDTCHMYTHMLGQFDYVYTNKVYIYGIYIYTLDMSFLNLADKYVCIYIIYIIHT